MFGGVSLAAKVILNCQELSSLKETNGDSCPLEQTGARRGSCKALFLKIANDLFALSLSNFFFF